MRFRVSGPGGQRQAGRSRRRKLVSRRPGREKSIRFVTFCAGLLDVAHRAYGNKLVTVAIFGSWARRAATPLSDIDVLLIVEELPRSRWERLDQFEEIDEATKMARARLWGGKNPRPLLTPVIKTPEEIHAGSPLFLDMTDWCKILWDRDEFFRNYLAGLKRRMKKLGTRRRWVKGGYYWEYKPDLEPGEVVEL